MSGANIAFAQSPPGIGRKRPSLPGQPLGDPASGVPFGCRKCVPFGVPKPLYLHIVVVSAAPELLWSTSQEEPAAHALAAH